ncbi:DUF2634 domain-containing protein [Neobacillus mesonae]|uniref:DUF2634 domain-containing protein n=1 Tax=Neobacillus mesonae TaxID=1193713 RepID=A0A3T0HVB1_9BACI|nr:DUF2634 domain-containing protein [Neobacillus mesonae]AZU61082.1 hypothetical protein CHR53_07340 [Neobacillus mesonae]
MALSPLETFDDETIEEVEAQPGPSRTYKLNSETNEIGGFIDGEAALRQFIEKAIRTARFRFLIYDDDYGCELEELLGEDITQELLEMEIPDIITDALIYDDRINDVTNFAIDRQGDAVYISFDVDANLADEQPVSSITRYTFGAFIHGIILLGEEAA